MKGFKLLQMLLIVERDQWKSLSKYMRMYFNEGSDHDKMMEFMAAHKSNFNSLPPKDEIQSLLFPTMSKKSFLNLLSRLSGWVEEWFVWQDMQNKPLERQVALVDIFNRKGAYPVADVVYKKTIKQVKSIKGASLKKNKLLAELYHASYYSDNPVKYKEGKSLLQKLVKSHLENSRDNANLYLVELQNWGAIQGFDFRREIQQIHYLNKLEIESECSLVISYLIDNVENHNVRSFYRLWELVRNDTLADNSDLKIITVLYLASFSVKLWIRGEIKESQIVIDIHNYALEEQIFFPDGIIQINRFNMLITTIAIIGDFNQSRDFINKWIHKVEKEHQDSLRIISMAYISAYNNRYDDVLTLLRDLDSSNRYIKHRALLIELIARFNERHEARDILMVRIQNAKRVFRSKFSNASDQQLLQNINFVKVIEKMMQRDYKEVNIDLSEYKYLTLKNLLAKELKKQS